MRLAAARDVFDRIARLADRHSPQTLFARALIIIVVPMLLLQALSAWWFYSQRGDNVTNRLAILLVRDLRMLIALRADFPDDAHHAWIIRHARPGPAALRQLPQGHRAAVPGAGILRHRGARGPGRDRCRPQAALLHRQQRRRRPDADRDPAQRRRRDGRAGAAPAPDLRLELRLRARPARPGAGAVRPGDLVHAPRAGADRASRRRGRRAGQGPRRARLRLLRRHPRGAQRRDRLPDHAHPPAALDPAAHRDAGRRQPRPAHAAHPHEAVPGDAARVAGDPGTGRRRCRHGAHDRGLSRLRPRRGRRGAGTGRPVGDPRGRGGRRAARQCRRRGRLAGRHGRSSCARSP